MVNKGRILGSKNTEEKTGKKEKEAKEKKTEWVKGPSRNLHNAPAKVLREKAKKELSRTK